MSEVNDNTHHTTRLLLFLLCFYLRSGPFSYICLAKLDQRFFIVDCAIALVHIHIVYECFPRHAGRLVVVVFFVHFLFKNTLACKKSCFCDWSAWANRIDAKINIWPKPGLGQPRNKPYHRLEWIRVYNLQLNPNHINDVLERTLQTLGEMNLLRKQRLLVRHTAVKIGWSNCCSKLWIALVIIRPGTKRDRFICDRRMSFAKSIDKKFWSCVSASWPPVEISTTHWDRRCRSSSLATVAASTYSFKPEVKPVPNIMLVLHLKRIFLAPILFLTFTSM